MPSPRCTAYVVALLLASCASAPPPSPAYPPAGTCDDLLARADAFHAAHESCTRDSDCVSVSTRGDLHDESCGVVYLNQSGSAGWAQLVAERDSCTRPGSGATCAALPAEPACIQGTCGPKP